LKLIDDFPRVRFAHLPTPLEPMERLGAELGCPSLWVKRDDCTGLASGGNKTRKLEFLIAEALQSGADTILSFGALQSNHARQTAAAANKVGLRCRLVLVDMVEYREPAYEISGNLFLDQLLGAELDIVDNDQDAVAATQSILEEESQAGRQVYVIPTGGSNTVGSLGYVECARELIDQTQTLGIRIGTIVLGTSSAGTQAGLVAGFAAMGASVDVLGINVYKKNHDALEADLSTLVEALAVKLEIGPIPKEALRLQHGFLGDGYGIPTPAMREAVDLVARCEGLLLDPVYTGKAMAGLMSLLREGSIHETNNANADAIIFLHTGGMPGLFAYLEAFNENGTH